MIAQLTAHGVDIRISKAGKGGGRFHTADIAYQQHHISKARKAGRSKAIQDDEGRLRKPSASFNLAALETETMSTVTFDTLKFVKTLEQAGFNAQQAEALAQAQQTAISESAELILATKDDANLIRADVAKVDAEIRLLKWMTGATFAAVMAILLRLFVGLPH
ncbi:MAG: hypothetical protein Q7U97_01035 [Rhodocyclaceae bacterium]|nr:hypothetical protein [Rhodocyclaceae bacterium]